MPGPARPNASPTEADLVRDHVALVEHIVSETAMRLPRHVRRDDLVSAGMVGLAEAAKRYDAGRDVKFGRYASTRIRGAILDELRGADWATRGVRAEARRFEAARDELAAGLGRQPTLEEVAQRMGITVKAVRELVDDVQRASVVNLEALSPVGLGGAELPADDRDLSDVLVQRERVAYLRDAVAALPERLRRVVVGYFFDERQMQDIADELGVTESRVSQMRAEAVALLRDGLNAQLEPQLVPDERAGRAKASRRAAYFAAIASASDYRARVSATPAIAAPQVTHTA